MSDISREQVLKELDEKVKQLCEIYYEDGRKIGLFSSEECEDAVSKKAILEMLVDIDNAICDGDGFQYQEWHTKVDELPSVLPKAKWIPVTTRKPKLEERVLIFTEDGKIEIAYRDNIPWTENQYEYVVISMLGYKFSYEEDKVLAWMPLPKPYREVEE